MKTIRHIILLFICCLLFVGADSPPLIKDIPNDIIFAIKVGSAEELSIYFNDNIELVIQEDEDIYSKAQAKIILDNFFEKHFPKSFSIIHQGGKDESRFAIGKLITFNGTFRVYFLLKIKNNKPYIHQLRIENENE